MAWHGLAVLTDGFLMGSQSDAVVGGYKSEAPFQSTPPGSSDNYDFWLLRVDASGAKVWDRIYGGGRQDQLRDMHAEADGNAWLAGQSRTIETGDPPGNKTAPGFGDMDGWLVRIAPDGEPLWDKAYGGTAGEALNAIAPDGSGGFWLAGFSSSPQGTGNKTAPHFGGSDAWLLRIDADGNKLWDQSFGGSANEGFTELLPLAGGGALVCGWSDSGAGGNKSAPSKGGRDYWCVLVDDDGNYLGDWSFGGSAADHLTCALDLGDDTFLLGGYSNSPVSGDKSEPFWVPDPPNEHNPNMRRDYWVLRVALDDTPLAADRPTLLAQAAHAAVRLDWRRLPADAPAIIERSADAQAWTPIHSAPDTAGIAWDRDINAGNIRYYRLRSGDDFSPVVRVEMPVPAQPRLTVGPNPFRDELRLQLSLPEAARIEVRLYDAQGRVAGVSVPAQALGAGTHAFQADAADLPQGVYALALFVDGARVHTVKAVKL